MELNIENKIEKFLSVKEQYDIAKETAINIMVKASSNDQPNFASELDNTIHMICVLHLLHGLTFQQIEAEAEYIIEGEMENGVEMEGFNL